MVCNFCCYIKKKATLCVCLLILVYSVKWYILLYTIFLFKFKKQFFFYFFSFWQSSASVSSLSAMACRWWMMSLKRLKSNDVSKWTALKTGRLFLVQIFSFHSLLYCCISVSLLPITEDAPVKHLLLHKKIRRRKLQKTMLLSKQVKGRNKT